MRPLWIKAAAVLAGIWLLVGGAVWWARSHKPTPDSISRYVSTHSLDGKSPADRDKIIGQVADQLNGLEYDDRRSMRMNRSLNPFFKSLSPDEQGRFLDLTLPTNFKQMMEAFNKMAPEKRKEFVQKAMSDMKQREGDQGPKEDDPNMQKMIQEGMRAFYSDANADVKMDFSPLIEQMQKNLQNFR